MHDTIEDTNLTAKEIEIKFGKKAAVLVNNLTRKKLTDETETNRYERKYQNFLETKRKDLDTRMLKSCDWLDNMRSWALISHSHPSREKFPRWFREAEEMYIPLAQTVNSRLVEMMKDALAKAKGSL